MKILLLLLLSFLTFNLPLYAQEGIGQYGPPMETQAPDDSSPNDQNVFQGFLRGVGHVLKGASEGLKEANEKQDSSMNLHCTSTANGSFLNTECQGN